MRTIQKIIFSIIPSLLLLSGAKAAAETTTFYCPSDSNNPAIYTFKRGDSLPEGWITQASWDLDHRSINTFNNSDPVYLKNNLTEGQYSFLSAVLYPNKLICSYALFSDTGTVLAVFDFYKVYEEGASPTINILFQSNQLTPQVGHNGWFLPIKRFYDPGTPQYAPMCGSLIKPGAKVTDCPLTQ